LRARIEASPPRVPGAVSARWPQITQLTVEDAGGGSSTALAVVSDGLTQYALLATIVRHGGLLLVSNFQPWD
jgi:hypothetical protein